MIIGMLHLSGQTSDEKVNRALRETNTYFENGVDAVLVENYHGTCTEMECVLDHLAHQNPAGNYGVNVLGGLEHSFMLAEKYNAKFIQIDSVVGHLFPRQEAAYFDRIQQLRASSAVLVLGGVHFKYQPHFSGRSFETDVRVANTLCDGIVVADAGTNIETNTDMLRKARQTLPQKPIVVGAGVNTHNAATQMSIVHHAIIGSAFKPGSDTMKEVDPVLVRQIVTCIKGHVPTIVQGHFKEDFLARTR